MGHKIPWRRAWPPSPGVLLGKSYDRGAWCAIWSMWLQTAGHEWSNSMHECQILDFLKGPFPQTLILFNFSSWHFYLSWKSFLGSIYRWSPQTYDGSTLWFFFFFLPLPWFKSNTHSIETIMLICSWVRYFLVMMDRGSLSSQSTTRSQDKYTIHLQLGFLGSSAAK